MFRELNFFFNRSKFFIQVAFKDDDNLGMKLEINQKLYSETKDGQIKTHIVSKIGNKYFEVENDRERYVIETLCRDSEWSRTQLYLDDKELENKIEFRILIDMIRTKFKGYGDAGITLDQARKIKSILEEK